MNVAYLLTGGNTGNRLQYLQIAAAAINKQCGRIVKKSIVYETAAWGLEKQNNFLNQGIKLFTTFSPYELLDCLLQIEENMGRVREEKYGPRIIDIDILLFNDDVIDTRSLQIPHPELPNRRFALQCLCDIARNKIHPVYKKTIARMLKECADPLRVDKFD
jgi:2-amino-4-hydroxy-6-hydroxymethyldihydropteridine diphosphokinase